MPLLREGECIGLLAMAGKRTNVFGASEIALVRPSRDQALIAIENTRLFNETREALERQTATADVLRIISRSVADAAPVFETILESCERLFNPYDAAVYLVEGDRVRGVARRGPGAGDGRERVSDAARGQLDRRGDRAAATGPLSRSRRQGRPAGRQKSTCENDWRHDGALRSDYLRISRCRLSRCHAPAKKAFTETEIELMQTFADQAAIAIENARLFNETKEALERQTATSEILR